MRDVELSQNSTFFINFFLKWKDHDGANQIHLAQ